jgi:hypothetical protein
MACYRVELTFFTFFRQDMNMISGFRRHVDGICALLGCYVELSGNPLPTFRDNIGPMFKGREGPLNMGPTVGHGIGVLSRNVGKGWPVKAE